MRVRVVQVQAWVICGLGWCVLVNCEPPFGDVLCQRAADALGFKPEVDLVIDNDADMKMHNVGQDETALPADCTIAPEFTLGLSCSNKNGKVTGTIKSCSVVDWGAITSKVTIAIRQMLKIPAAKRKPTKSVQLTDSDSIKSSGKFRLKSNQLTGCSPVCDFHCEPGAKPDLFCRNKK